MLPGKADSHLQIAQLVAPWSRRSTSNRCAMAGSLPRSIFIRYRVGTHGRRSRVRSCWSTISHEIHDLMALRTGNCPLPLIPWPEVLRMHPSWNYWRYGIEAEWLMNVASFHLMLDLGWHRARKTSIEKRWRLSICLRFLNDRIQDFQDGMDTAPLTGI